MEDKDEGQNFLIKAISLIMQNYEDGQEIIRLLNKALECKLSHTDRAMAHACRGGVYLQQGRLTEAEAELKNALRFDEKFGDNPLMLFTVWRELAVIYEERGEVDYAAECLRKGIEQLQALFDYDDVKRLICHFYFFLVDLYLRNQHIESNSLVNDFLTLQRFVEKDPSFIEERANDYPETYFVLGGLYSNKKIKPLYDPIEAIEYYEKYLTLTQSNEVPLEYPSDIRKHEIRVGLSLEKLRTLREEI